MKKFILYFDILGFEKLPSIIAKKIKMEENYVRETFFTNKVREVVAYLKDYYSSYGKYVSSLESSDSYIVIIEELNNLYKFLNEITHIEIPHKDFSYVPLEVAIDEIELEEDVDLINNSNVIKFLKNDIITLFKNNFKEIHKKSIRHSFVVATYNYVKNLSFLDQEKYHLIKYENKNFYTIDINYIKERVLLLEFLNQIGIPNSFIYNRINEVYVPPIEYHEIHKILSEKHIVFITGTQEYGKTFTAVRLLWEFFKKNYKPIWLKGAESLERLTMRRILEDINQILESKSIIYFEDPFGKFKYERRENLERYINDIIDAINLVKDSYVIITSREEIFKEYEKETLTIREIKEFENKLNIKKPSYEFNERKNILLNWAKVYDCVWLDDEDIVENILKYLKIDVNLPTPLSIKSFVSSTTSMKCLDNIYEKIFEKSEETEIAFAKEILSMTEDRMLFLCFPSIASFDYAVIKKMYNDLVNKIKIEKYDSFKDIIYWFIDDKINIFYTIVSFSHPSYNEAMIYLLKNEKESTPINLLYEVLKKTSNSSFTSRKSAQFIEEYYEYIPKQVRIICLLNLSYKRNIDAYSILLDIFENNVDDIPPLIGKKILLNVSANKPVSYKVYRLLTRYMKYLSKRTIQIIILNLSKYGNRHSIYGILKLIYTNYENYEIIEKDVIDNIVYKGTIYDNTFILLKYIDENYEMINNVLKNDILLQISENNDIQSNRLLGWIVYRYFEKINEKTRINIIKNLSKKEETVRIVSLIIYKKFDSFPIRIRNNLLKELSSQHNAILNIVKILKEKPHMLSKRMSNTIKRNLRRTQGDLKYVISTYLAE